MEHYQHDRGKNTAAIEVMLIRAAKEDIPIRVMARVFGYSEEKVRESLLRAYYYHRILQMPPDDWSHFRGMSQQLPCSELIWKGHPDRDVADTSEAFKMEQGAACVLMYLVKKSGSFCSASSLVEATTMNPEKIESNIIRVRVSAVRKRITPIGARIITKRGFGYMIPPSSAQIVVDYVSAFRQKVMGEVE